jgi:hypothetical protein
VDSETFSIRYGTAFDLMHDLGRMGESNAVKTRRLHVPRSTVLAASAYYQHAYADAEFENTIPATFQVRLTLIAHSLPVGGSIDLSTWLTHSIACLHR